MTKVRFTAFVSDVRGSIDSTVFAKNRGGAYSRMKVIPSNPQSTEQTYVRNLFGTYSNNWKTLTDEQREMWRQAVPEWKKLDVFGKQQNPTGLGLYIKVNLSLLQVNSIPVTVPPLLNTTVGQVHVRTNFQLQIPDTNNIAISWEGGNLAPDNALLVRASRQLSSGISFVKSEFRFLFQIGGLQNSPVSFWNQYTNKYGPLQSGLAIFCEAWIVSTTSGKSIKCGYCKGIIP